MWSKVRAYIEKHNLLNTSELYIVALSGGADSVALLLLLKEHGFNVHAAHCNFHLRGAESDRDETFCEQLCAKRNIPFHRAHFDTLEYASLHKVSVEMAARELRYRWFGQLCEDLDASGVCVAHHRDDSVETVVLNMVRGTGVRGLTGIKPKTYTNHVKGQAPCVVLRPLLCVSRAEIEDFLAERNQKYVTDSTNLEDEATRNKVRHHIIPELQLLNSKAMENIQRMTERMAATEQLIDAYKKERRTVERGRIAIRKCDVLNDYLLYELIADYGFNTSQATQIFECIATESVGSIFSSADYDLLVDREHLLVEPHLEPMKPLVIPETGTYILDETHRIRVENGDFPVSKDPLVATLDASKVSFPLTVRRVEEGDWMVPFGMKGRKLLSDLMTDLKMPIFDKRKQLVIVDNQGVIVWAVSLRVDQNVAIFATETTTSVLRISFS